MEQQSETPLKDAYAARLQAVNAEVRYSQHDISDLRKGDYAAIKTAYATYFGFVKSIGPKNVIIESPYGGWADNDYKDMQELKFPKSQIAIFSHII